MADRIRARSHRGDAVRARYDAALTALFVAQIYAAMANDEQKTVWRDRALEHYLASYEDVLLPMTARTYLEPSITQYAGALRVSHDYDEYRRLQRIFEDACAELS